MTERALTVTKDNILTMTQTIWKFLSDAVTRGDVIVTFSREKRTGDQNKLLWGVLTDVSQQVEWHGQKLTPEEWKHILSAAWKGQKVLPGIDGSLVVFGQSTSKLTKADFSDLIEVIYAFGSEQGVKWKDDSVAIFETYRQAQ
jgi:hypothetical protein